MKTLAKFGRTAVSEHLIWLILLALCIFGITVKGFMTERNIINIFWSAAPLGAMVLGMFFVMLVSGLDLSIESTFAFGPTVAVMYMTDWIGGDVNPVLGIVIALVVGMLVGFINGMISIKLRVNPFLVTLATMLLMRGIIIYWIPEGVYYLPSGFTFLGNFRFGGVFPIAILIMVLLYVLAYFITNHFSFGKSMYAIGNNAQAAYVAGINVDKVKIATFVLAGLFAAIGGLIEVGRLSSVVADLGEGGIMMVFAATILGGTSMSGGEGRITGIFGAVLVLSIIDNLLNLFGVDPSVRQMMYGVILLIAIYLASMQLKPVQVAEA